MCVIAEHPWMFFFLCHFLLAGWSDLLGLGKRGEPVWWRSLSKRKAVNYDKIIVTSCLRAPFLENVLLGVNSALWALTFFLRGYFYDQLFCNSVFLSLKKGKTETFRLSLQFFLWGGAISSCFFLHMPFNLVFWH